MKKVFVALVFAFLVFVPKVHGRTAPTFVAVTQGDTAGSQASLSFSVTVSSGTNLAMFVGISNWAGAGGAAISTVTFNGDSLTKICDTSAISDDVDAGYWGIANPDVATGNVVITPASSTWISAGAVVVSGVDQSTITSACNANSEATGDPTIDVTSNSNELVLDVVAWWNNVTASVNCSQTQRWSESEASTDNKSGGSTKAGTSTTTMCWNFSGGNIINWAMAAISIKGAAATNNFPALFFAP